MNFLIDALATYRLTRLATEDTLTEPLREYVFNSPRLPDPSLSHYPPPHSPFRPNPAYILTCPHCASIYAAAFTLIAPAPLKKILALAAVTTLIHEYTENRTQADATGWE